jgi:hypothetical protein
MEYLCKNNIIVLVMEAFFLTMLFALINVFMLVNSYYLLERETQASTFRMPRAKYT